MHINNSKVPAVVGPHGTAVALVGIMVMAALITPSSDAFTMMLVVLPLMGLYELSRRVVRRVERSAAGGTECGGWNGVRRVERSAAAGRD